MTQYREILRLFQAGISQRSIAASCHCSRNTVATVAQQAKQTNIKFPLDSQTDAELEAFVNMFRYCGGSAIMLVPDNLKTGVDRTQDWYTPQINRTYHELAEYYNTAVVPARVRRPKDKGSVEGTVGAVSARIIAALRNRKFLPCTKLIRQSMRNWKTIIRLPFQDLNRFIQWGDKIDPATATVVKSILSSFKVEQQGYRSCMGLLRLADKHSVERLEAAFRRALSFTPQPSFKSVKTFWSSDRTSWGKRNLLLKIRAANTGMSGVLRITGGIRNAESANLREIDPDAHERHGRCLTAADRRSLCSESVL